MGNCESDSRNPNAFTPPSNNTWQRPNVTVHGSFPFDAKSRDVDVVNVVVPPGVYAGQTINVIAPDGTGRTVSAVVPSGMGPGSQFMVKFPPSYAPSAPVEAQPQTFKSDFATATSNSGSTAYPMAAATLINDAEEPAPFSQALDLPPPAATSDYQPQSQPYPQPQQQQQQSSSLPPSGQMLLRVRVPPGVPPGASINVAIPDEPGRVLTVQVPPNTTEFNVAYYPSTVPVPTIAATSSSYTYNNNNNSYPNPQQMPPSNSFPSNNNKFNRFSNNNNHGYNNNNNYNNNGYNNNNNNGYNNNNNHNNNRPGVGGLILPVLGGVALGAAAMELFDGDLGDW